MCQTVYFIYFKTVSGSIPGGVTEDFFRGTPDRTMCPEVNSASESEYQGICTRIKVACVLADHLPPL